MSFDPKQLVEFLREGQALRSRLRDDLLPIEEHNSWVERMNVYFRERNVPEYEVRLSDFSGMTFYGDGSERSKMSKSIDGRSQRLHEFIGEIQSGKESEVVILKPNFCGFGIDLRAGWKRLAAKWGRRGNGSP